MDIYIYIYIYMLIYVYNIYMCVCRHVIIELLFASNKSNRHPLYVRMNERLQGCFINTLDVSRCNR